ncbi:MAG: dienelactone hydrolase family protein, partial [Dehalococcoidia bacterium]|nr:dienelactone hydrolase family protein [Dehalococcoidia bacterium]
MCFPYDAHPPIAPIAGAAVDSEDLTLEASDGNRFAAFAARSGNSNAPGIVVLPDVRGLFRFYEELALRFAEQGMNSIAFDYFGRTAGVAKRGEDFPYQEHVAQARPESIAADVAASVSYLRSAQGGESGPIFSIGFCFGGSNSWMQAVEDHGLSGAIGFYGRPVRRWDDTPGPTESVERFKCPILGLMAGDDAMITLDQVDEYKKALERAGVEHDVTVYPGAPHSFFDRTYEEHAEASADAWRRVLEFIN